MLWSSRCVIKNQNFETNPNEGFYGSDIWKIAADTLKPFLKDGISVYGEIVGFTDSGKYIQKDYDYGCPAGKCAMYIYRITYTSASGDVYEFNHHQIKSWCDKFGYKMVPEFFYGYAKDLYPDIPTESEPEWRELFINRLMEDYLEKDCPLCVNAVPAEGIVVRVDQVHDYDAYKLKSFRFFERETKELDAGVIDMESAESQDMIDRMIDDALDAVVDGIDDDGNIK